MKILLAVILVVLASVPAVTAKLPDDQVKSAGAIALNEELLNKLDKAAKAVRADEAARTEIAGVKETGRDAVVAAINSKCPKTVAHFKEAGITADELMDSMSAMLACIMDESGELATSGNETAKANADFVKKNKERVDALGGALMAMGTAPDASDPAKKP